jgi:uncharacterized protein YdaU (DUF1376 family)
MGRGNVNYYRRFPGDYARDTRHLNFIEHGAYTLLLDVYYSNEKPFPINTRESAIKVGARNEDEIEAIGRILKEFFNETSKGWIHKRVKKEISIYKSKINALRANGKRGGRPKKQMKSNCLAIEKQNEPSPDPTPDPDPDKKEKSKSLVPSAHKKRSTLPLNFQLTPDLRAFAITQGMNFPEMADDEFEAFCDFHKSKGSVFRDWPAAWRTWARNYSKFRRNGNEQNSRKSFDAIREENNKNALRQVLEHHRSVTAQTGGSTPERTQPGSLIDLPRKLK